MKKMMFFVFMLFTSMSYASKCGVVKSVFLEENSAYTFYLADGKTNAIVKDPVLVDLVKASFVHGLAICYDEYAVFGGVFMIERAEKKKR